MNAIETRNLTKKFGDNIAVNNINLNVKKGEIFAFLGPNGAGKSTTIKMLTTVLFPTEGELRVAGYDVTKNKDKVRASIGVIFQDHSLDDRLTAYENMYYHSALYKIPRKERRKRIEELLNNVGLASRENDLIKKFSGGMKRRVEVARGLLHTPNVAFLDEPTLGLDVQTKSFLWDYIKRVNKEKKVTVFLTTHNMDEAEKVADRIAIIDKGKIIALGTSREIKKKTKTKSLEEAFLSLTGRRIREQTFG